MNAFRNRSPSVLTKSASALTATLFISLAGATVIDGPIVNPANGHTYYLLDTATWTDSESEAVGLGGHLVTINNAAENDFVFDTFSTRIPDTLGSILWIGFNDAAQEGNFVWASGQPVTYTNWQVGFPDNAGNQDYAWMWTPQAIPQDLSVIRQWNDASNDGFSGIPYGVVEVPEPSTLLLLIGGVAALALRSRAFSVAGVISVLVEKPVKAHK